MVAAETSEALGVEGGTGASRLVEINSGGVVFFVLLNSPGEHEEAVVLKFCNNRRQMQHAAARETFTVFILLGRPQSKMSSNNHGLLAR